MPDLRELEILTRGEYEKTGWVGLGWAELGSNNQPRGAVHQGGATLGFRPRGRQGVDLQGEGR